MFNPDSCFSLAAGGLIVGYSTIGDCKVSDLIIPKTIGGNQVLGIDSSVFSGKQLTSIKIPSTVTNIGVSAFQNN